MPLYTENCPQARGFDSSVGRGSQLFLLLQSEMESLKELLLFLQPDQRLDLKSVSLTHVLGLTGSAEGRAVLFDLPEIIHAIIMLTQDKTQTIAKDAVLSLINLTAEETGAIKVLETNLVSSPSFSITGKAIKAITDPESNLADPWSMVLSNLTRVESLVGTVIDEIEKNPDTIFKLVEAFSKLDYNKKGAKLHYLGPIFCNITQTSQGRKLFCDPNLNVLDKIIPFVSFQDNIVRRGGTIGVLKNVCFDPMYHEIVTDDKSDVFPNLLLPLAGPEEFTDEENEKLPIELQYLGEEKQREQDPDLRRMLLECLLQLCATKKIRTFLRAKGVYEILREYHKWENRIGGDKDAIRACENVVDILIKKEEEIGVDNLKDVEVPSDLSKKFAEDENLLLHD